MTSPFTAICAQRDDWWVGWIEEIPGVNAQERTKPELMASLKEVLTEALVFNRADARAAAGQNYTEEPVAVWSAGIFCNTLTNANVTSSAKEETIPGGAIPPIKPAAPSPRHSEINDLLIRKICRDLQIPQP